MIRAVYRWHVKAGEEDTFVKAWEQGTQAIRERIQGAQGSLLLHSYSESSEFVAIARWQSFEDWQAFSRDQTPDPEALQRMTAVSTLVSTEVFEEVQDLLTDTL